MKMTRLAITLLGVAALAAASGLASAQNVDLSLNVFPTIIANPNGGGNWTLVAKTNWVNGIAAINTYISGINAEGITYAPGINAELLNGGPFVIAGNPVNALYFQNTAAAGVIVGVGTPSFSPNVDPLGNPAWNNATAIFMGTYPGTVPFFAPKGSNVTDANVLSTPTAPFNNSLDAETSFIVRVQVPEPATGVLASVVTIGLARRRRTFVVA